MDVIAYGMEIKGICLVWYQMFDDNGKIPQYK